MAWRRIGAKPWSKPILSYCQQDPEEPTSVTFWSKYKPFHSRKSICKYRLWNGGYFVLKSISPICFGFAPRGDSEIWVPSQYIDGLSGYGDFRNRDKRAYLYNGDAYTGKTTSLYYDGALIVWPQQNKIYCIIFGLYFVLYTIQDSIYCVSWITPWYITITELL